jgi:hypothetical protein
MTDMSDNSGRKYNRETENNDCDELTVRLLLVYDWYTPNSPSAADSHNNYSESSDADPSHRLA